MDKRNVTLVASLGAVLLALMALGVSYRLSQAPIAKLAQSQQGNIEYLNLQIRSCRQQIESLQKGASAQLSDSVRLLDNLVYALENEDNESRDPARPPATQALHEAKERLSEWFRD